MPFWTVFAIVLSAVSFTASYVQAKKAQKRAKRLADEMAGVLVNKESNIEAIPVIYGERRVGGVRVYMTTSGDDRHEYLYVALVVAEGRVEQISDLEIDEVPATDSRFQGLVSWHYKLGDDDQTTSSILDDSLITVDDSDPNWEYQGIVVTNQAFVNNFRLRGVAYVAIRLKYDAEVFAGVPDFTVKVKGRRVYDPRKDSTSTHYDSNLGVSDHRATDNSTWDWSDNPALCLRDYLTNERFGKGLDASDIDDTEFMQAADDIESFTVTPYSGGSSDHKLFSLNAVIDTNEQIFTNVEKILLSCRGFLPYTFGKYGLKVDQAGSSVMTLGTDKIIGDINIVGSRKEDRFNQVIVKFPDANTRFQPNNVAWPNQSSSNPTGVSDGNSGYLTEAQLHAQFLAEDGELLVDEIDLEHCTDIYQARDLARIFLWRSRNALNVAFQATSEAMELTVGDVVSITHPTPNWTAKKFQVDEMGINYDGTVTLKCVEYDATIYAYDSAVEQEDLIDIITGDPGNVQAPTNVTGTNTGSALLDDGTFHAVLNVSWTASQDATVTEYQVRYKLDSETPYKYLNTTDTTVRIEGMAPGTYNIGVRALDGFGGKSGFTDGSNVNTGIDTTIPGDITNTSVTSGIGNLVASWENPDDDDLKQIRVYVATTDTQPTNPTAVVTGESYAVTNVVGDNDAARTRYFWLQAEDYSGNVGNTTASFNGIANQATGDDIGTGEVDTGNIADDAVDITKIANTLESTNYSQGSAGWKLTTDGTFEAGDGLFRGDIQATVLDVENANVHGTLTATNIAAGIVTADTLAADVFAEFDDRYGGSGGFYRADNDEFFDGSATKYVTLPTVTHDDSKSIRFQCNLVHSWGTTQGYGGTNGLKVRVTFEYSSDNTTWAKVPSSGENSQDYYERSATVTTYTVTSGFDIAADIRFEMTGSSLSDNTAYYFRVKIEYVSATNAFTSATLGSGNGVPIKFNVQQTAGLTASAGDADTVDGLQASQFLRSDTSDTFSGNLTVTGNLTVQGSQTQLDTQTLTVEDNNIVLNYSTGDSSGSADDSGITIQDAVNSSTDASILWKATGDYFQFSHPINAISSASNAYAAEFRGAPQPQGPSGMVSNGVKITAGSSSTDTVLLVQELDNTAILTINGFGQTTFANSVTIDGQSVTGTKIGQWNTAYTYSQVGHLPLAGGTLTGRVTFPTGSTTKPILAEGFFARTTSDTTGTHDIWGISGQYNPSASSAADQWGIQWSGSPNEINFIGAGQKKLSIDLDTAGDVEIDGNRIWDAGDFTSTNITNWNTAYTYSQVGHLPLSGGTITGGSVDISSAGQTLTVRGGNTSSGTTNKQIILGYSGTTQYAQNIRTRHNSGVGSGNAIDFYLWDQANDASTDHGSMRVLKIETGKGVDLVMPSGAYQLGGSTVIASTRRFYASNGTTVKAAYSFDGDSGTGISRTAAGRIDFLSSGAVKAYIRTGTTNPISDTMYVDGQLGVNGKVVWSGGSSTNANTAYSWGDHSAAGYLTGGTNFANDRLITASGSDSLNGEANLTFNGTSLSMAGQLLSTYIGGNGGSGSSHYGIHTESTSAGQATMGAHNTGDGYANLNLSSVYNSDRKMWHISKRPHSNNDRLEFFWYESSGFASRYIFNTNGNFSADNNITAGGSFVTPTASTAQGIYAGSTQVFEGSTRNLKNIGSISSGVITSSGLISNNTSTTADKIGDIKIIRKHGSTGVISTTDSLDTFILSKTDSGWGGGTQPSGSDNAQGIISLQTHSGNYYSQLNLVTNGNNLFIRSAHNSASYSNWEKLLKENANITVGTIAGTGTNNVYAATFTGATGPNVTSLGLNVKTLDGANDVALLVEKTDGTDLFKITGQGVGSFSERISVQSQDVTGTRIQNWQTAYGWGDHSTAGYLETNDNITVGTISSGAITSTGTSTIDAIEIDDDYGVRFGHANEVDTNDGRISAGRHGNGLNIVGVQTASGTGRQVRVWGALIDDAGHNYIRDGVTNSSNLTITGAMQADNGYKIGSTTVINSSRNFINVAGITTENSSSNFVDLTPTVNGQILHRFWNKSTGGSASAAMRIANSGNTNQGTRLEFSDQSYYVGTVSADRNNGMEFYVGQMTSPLQSMRMNISTGGNVAIGTGVESGFGKLHIKDSDSGATPYQSGNGGLTIERNGRVAINLLTPNTQDAYLFFGDPETANAGFVGYEHSTDLLVIKSQGYVKTQGSGLNISGGNLQMGGVGVIDGSRNITAAAISSAAISGLGKHTFTGDNSTEGTLRIVANSSKGARVSHVHYGANGDWYIRSSGSGGSVIIQDGSGVVSLGTISSNITFNTSAEHISFGSGGTSPSWGAPIIFRESSHLALSDYSGVKLGGYNGTAYGPRFHVNGNGNVDILEGNLRMGTTTVIASTRRLYASNGTVTKASFSFDGESNTGMYKYGTNQIGFTAGGNLMAYIQSGSTYGLVVQSKISATGGNSDNWNAGYTYSTVGHLPLAGGTMSARINFFNSNVQAPTSTDATTGARLNLYPNGSGNDYTIGIEPSNMWFNTDGGFKWYEDGAARMQMETGGHFNLSTGSLKTNGVTRIANNGNATLGTISSGAITSSGVINAGSHVSATTDLISNQDIQMNRSGTSPALTVYHHQAFRLVTDVGGTARTSSVGVNASGVFYTNTGFAVNNTTVIDSSRVLQNVTLKAGGLGSRFEHNNWHQSSDGYNRFYFANASHTYFRTGSAYVFRDNGDVGRATISAYGGVNLLSGGDGHVASNVALAVGGTTVIDSARHATFAKVFSDNLSTTADRIGAIKIARLHPTSGTAPVTSIDNLETFILSKTDGGYGSGTKPSGGDNATGIISLQTHTGTYYTQLALQTNGNNLWIRSAHASSSYGSWEKLVKENANTTLGTTTTGALTATNISATSLTLSGTFSPTGISATGDIAGGQFRASYGSESAPAFTFKNDDDTGMYGSANRIHFAVSGDEKIQVQPSSIILFESTTIQDELKVGTVPQTVIDTGRQLQNVTVSQGEAEYGQSLNGNFGQWLAHSRYAASPGFNQDVDYWGWNFVQGNVNAPHTDSGQWYRNRISLGNQYGHGISSGDYWLEIAHPRTTGITGQMYIRACESGSIGQWREVGSAIRGDQQVAGRVGIGTAPESGFGRLHIKESDSGATPYQTANGGITVERNGRTAINLLSPNTSSGYLFFADPQSAVAGYIGYDHSITTLELKSEGYVKTYGSGLDITAGNLEIAGQEVISGARNLTAVAANLSGVVNSTGGAKITIQNSSDGGAARGIMMWSNSDTNWGIYMSTAGSGKSLSGGSASSGLDGRTSHGIRFRVANSSTQIGFLFENGSEQALAQITADSGNFLAKGNVTAYASDERLKTNIKPIQRPLEKLMKLRGVEFDWIDGIEETHGFIPKCKHETGVIAQEVEQVIPDAISPAPFNNEYKTVEHTKIISLLIESVRSQQETIESLTKRIEELENGDN